ncbi:MAG: hypothetical protein WC830_09175 [Burkholderiales bacterium]|jgi:hypothetical protein
MSVFLARGTRTLKFLLLAFAVLFAQQAAQLHALGHAEDQLAQPHKGKAPGHPIEQCIAFHAVGSALTASSMVQDFDALHIERTPWIRSEARSSSVYRLPVRAPPQAV